MHGTYSDCWKEDGPVGGITHWNMVDEEEEEEEEVVVNVGSHSASVIDGGSDGGRYKFYVNII